MRSFSIFLLLPFRDPRSPDSYPRWCPNLMSCTASEHRAGERYISFAAFCSVFSAGAVRRWCFPGCYPQRQCLNFLGHRQEADMTYGQSPKRIRFFCTPPRRINSDVETWWYMHLVQPKSLLPLGACSLDEFKRHDKQAPLFTQMKYCRSALMYCTAASCNFTLQQHSPAWMEHAFFGIFCESSRDLRKYKTQNKPTVELTEIWAKTPPTWTQANGKGRMAQIQFGSIILTTQMQTATIIGLRWRYCKFKTFKQPNWGHVAEGMQKILYRSSRLQGCRFKRPLRAVHPPDHV